MGNGSIPEAWKNQTSGDGGRAAAKTPSAAKTRKTGAKNGAWTGWRTTSGGRRKMIRKSRKPLRPGQNRPAKPSHQDDQATLHALNLPHGPGIAAEAAGAELRMPFGRVHRLARRGRPTSPPRRARSLGATSLIGQPGMFRVAGGWLSPPLWLRVPLLKNNWSTSHKGPDTQRRHREPRAPIAREFLDQMEEVGDAPGCPAGNSDGPEKEGPSSPDHGNVAPPP